MFLLGHLLNDRLREPDIENACVTGTFDQPLWLKAVEIRASNSLSVVCRLGGFHMNVNELP